MTYKIDNTSKCDTCEWLCSKSTILYMYKCYFCKHKLGKGEVDNYMLSVHRNSDKFCCNMNMKVELRLVKGIYTSIYTCKYCKNKEEYIISEKIEDENNKIEGKRCK